MTDGGAEVAMLTHYTPSISVEEKKLKKTVVKNIIL